MPPVSRRKRRYEERAGKRKARNYGAVVFLMFTLLGVFLFFYFNWSRSESNFQVFIQRIKTANVYKNVRVRRHAIPFQEETCRYLQDTIFSKLNNAVFPAPDSGDIQGESVSVGMSQETAKKIGDSDIPLLYVNGHIKESENEGSQDVVWIDPDQKNEISVTQALTNFANSNGILKIVLLDAGQFSWSPNYPNRGPNAFQQKLDGIVKKIGADKNLWVIVSHSPNEISLTCTPYQRSIFSMAVAEAIKECAKDTDKLVSVEEFFKSIFDRCVSYSTNFDDGYRTALQHPILYRSGTGLVKELSDKQPELKFQSKAEFEEEKRSFGFRTSFSINDNLSSWFKDWLGNYRIDLHETPVRAFNKIEILADSSSESNFTADNPELEFSSLPGFIDDFEGPSQEVAAKRQSVKSFRTHCLRLAFQLRLASNFLIWSESSAFAIQSTFENQQYWPLDISYTNADLKSSPNFSELDAWNSSFLEFQEFLNTQWLFKNNQFEEELPRREEPDGSSGRLYLTPVQAELLGTTTQRLFTYCGINVADSKKEERKEEEPTPFPLTDMDFELNLSPENHPYTPGEIKDSVWQLARDRWQAIYSDRLSDYSQDSAEDSQRRIYLAVNGSEGMLDVKKVPVVDIELGEPSIQFLTQSKWELFDGHNFFKATIKNSQNFYEVEVKGEHRGLEIRLFEDMNQLSGTQNKLTVEKEFIFYVFVKPGVIKSADQVFTFEFSAKLPNEIDDQPILKSIDVPFNARPKYQVQSVRIQGQVDNEGNWSNLCPWKIESTEKFSQSNYGKPIQLKTFANLRSDFKFKIKNNSPVELDGVNAELYLLDGSIRNGLRTFARFPADEIPRAEEFNARFRNLVWNEPKFFEGMEEPHEKIAISENVKVDPMSEALLDLNFLTKPTEVNPDEPAAKKEPEDEYLEVKHPLLLVFFSNIEGKRHPLWFQFLELKPTLPFAPGNLNLSQKPFQLRELIVGKNQFQLESLVGFLPPVSLPNLPESGFFDCDYHVFSNESSGRKVSLPLPDAIEDQEFDLNVSKESVAMVDVIGIPNVKTMAIDEDQVAQNYSHIRTEKRAGIRVVSDFWAPSRPGFVFYHDLFENEPKDFAGRQIIYLKKQDAKQPGNKGDIQVEFSLPFLKSNSVVGKTGKFTYNWNEGETILSDPVERRFFFNRADGSFFSILRRHRKIQKDVPEDSRNYDLSVQLGSDTLGEWTITSKNPNSYNSILIFLKNLRIKSADEEIIVDFSRLIPSASDKKIGILNGGGEFISVADSNIFSERPREKYAFKLGQLMSTLSSFDFDAAIKQKEVRGGTLTIEIAAEATDFFGKTWRASKTIRFVVSRKIPTETPEKATNPKNKSKT